MPPKRAALIVALAGAGLIAAQALGSTGSGLQNPPIAPQATIPATPGASVAVPRPSVASPSASPSAGNGDIVAIGLRGDNNIVLVDPAAGKITRTIDAGLPPGAIGLTPDGQTAWVFNSKPGGNQVAVVDLAKGEKRQDRRLHDGPSAVAFSGDGTRAYVALSGEETSPPGQSSIAFLSTSGGELGQVSVGLQTKGVQIRRQLSALAVAPGPNGDVLYVAGEASGAVWALDAASGALLSELEVGGGPRRIVTDPARQRAYVVADALNQVIAIDTSVLAIADRINLPGRPASAAVGPDGTLYLAGNGSRNDDGQVWLVGADTRQLRDAVKIGGRPVSIAMASDGAQLYVADAANARLTALSATTLKVVASIPVGGEPVEAVVAQRAIPTGKQTTSPTPNMDAAPTRTSTIVPAPTALPEGVKPPEHMPSGAVYESFLAGAEFPVSLAFAPDGRLFYSELRTGKIRVVQNGTLLRDPFYKFAVAGQPETGLLGLVVDPDFAHNHYLYAFYTSVADGSTESGGSSGPNEVVRLTDVGNKGSELMPIMHLPSGPIHNGGTLRFGPDGKLYVSLGDNDQGSNAQDLNTLAGKILRVNPDGSIPDDNPFVGQSGKQPAVWAYGLRNPYSFAFHPVGHILLATENGPGDNDALYVIARGANYGWPPTGYRYKTGVVDPIAVMNPPIAPTSATFYLGDQIAVWKNDFFYCNYHEGQLRRVRLAPESFDRVIFEEVVKHGCTMDVASGPDGALYYTDSRGIYRIRQPGADVLPAVSPAPAPAAGVKPSPTEVLAAGTRPEDRDVNVTMSEFKLVPSRTTVPAGAIRLLAENVGAVPHALRVVGDGLDVSTDTFGPGQSRTLQIVLAAGTYQLICPLPGHTEQGMQTSLTVLAP